MTRNRILFFWGGGGGKEEGKEENSENPEKETRVICVMWSVTGTDRQKHLSSVYVHIYNYMYSVF